MTLYQQPQIEKFAKFPLDGKAHVLPFEITIKDIQVNSSSFRTEDIVISLVVIGTTTKLADYGCTHNILDWDLGKKWVCILLESVIVSCSFANNAHTRKLPKP